MPFNLISLEKYDKNQVTFQPQVFVIGDVPRKYEGKKPNFMSIYMIFFKILIDIIVYY